MKIIIERHFEYNTGEYLDSEEVQVEIRRNAENIIFEVDGVMYVIPVMVLKMFNLKEEDK